MIRMGLSFLIPLVGNYLVPIDTKKNINSENTLINNYLIIIITQKLFVKQKKGKRSFSRGQLTRDNENNFYFGKSSSVSFF